MARIDDKVTYKAITTTVNHDTGEVTREEETTHLKISNEPNYIKLYINTLLAFKELPKTLNPLLLELLSCMGYADPSLKNGGQLIVLNSYVKKQMAEKLNTKINTIEKSITSLTKAKLLRRIGTGTYQVNPNLFGKGEWKDIKAIRATFDFATGEIEAELKTDEDEEVRNNQV